MASMWILCCMILLLTTMVKATTKPETPPLVLPTLAHPLRNVSVSEGETAEFTCTVQNRSDPYTIYWLLNETNTSDQELILPALPPCHKNSDPILATGKHRLYNSLFNKSTHDVEIYTLQIQNVTSDASYLAITCVYNSSYKTFIPLSYDYVHINVLLRPLHCAAEPSVIPVISDVGVNIHLKCFQKTLETSSETSLEWSINGETISSGNGTISYRLLPDHSGKEFVCKRRGTSILSLGNQCHVTPLDIVAKPFITQQKTTTSST